MSKNLTRKGLALGALVALGSTLFAGTSAFAAGEINVAPAAGTSYNILSGEQFTLATTFAPGYTPSAYAQLKYLVTTDANSTVKFAAQNTTTGLAAAVTGATAQAVSTTSSAVAAGSTAATDVAYLGLSAVTTSVTSSVQVTAFVDANNNGSLDAGEWNTVKTVTFKKAADITPVVSLTQPNTGDTSLKATVAWGDLNTDEMTDETVKFTSGTQLSSAAAGTLASGVYTQTVTTALAASEAVTAQAYAGSTALGTAATASATARTISSITADLVKGNDSVGTTATVAAASTSGVVRTNGSFSAQVKALDTATSAAAAPAVAVKATVSVTGASLAALSSTNTTEVSITVNGTKYTDATALAAASFALTTNASGVATLPISTVGFAAGNTVTVSFAAQNFTSAVVATETAATYSVSDDNGSVIVATNKNTAANLSYSVKDQFGVLSALTNQRVEVHATNAVTATQYIAVAGGKAVFSVTPATDSTTAVAVTSSLETSSTDTAGNLTWTTFSAGSTTNTVQVRSAAYSFSTAPAIDATAGINGAAYSSTTPTKQTLTTVDQSNTAATGYVAPAAGTTWAKISLTGSNAGEKLTASGTGVFLSIDGATPTVGTASKVAQAAAAVVYVASNTTGAKTITITNGTVSATVVVTFDKSVAVTSSVANAGAVVALGSLATSSQAGRSVDVSATIVDKFGNPLQGATVTLSSTGVGYLANTTTTSDANGKVTGKLIVGALENGDAVVTASATLGDATTASAAKTITFGATDAQIDIVGNRVTATASYTSGKTVSFYVDGIKKWSKLSSSDADLVINSNLKKGTHTVSVKISGGFVTTEKFIVK